MRFGTRDMYCPNCGSNNCMRSRRRTAKEHLLGWIGILPFRCHDCNHRFRAFYPSFKSEKEAEER